MASAKNFYFLKCFIAILAINLVVSQKIEKDNCPLYCKDSNLRKDQIDICQANCGAKQVVLDSCIKECIAKNPEGSALCELKCKSSVSSKDNGDKKTQNSKDISPEEAMSLVGTVMNIHSRVNNMMDCMMDALSHQSKYGWFGQMFGNRISDWADDSFGKDNTASASGLSPLMENIDKGSKDIPAKPIVKLGKEEGVNKSTSMAIQPVYHRFIIIRHLVPFSIYSKGNDRNDDDDEDDDVKDKAELLNGKGIKNDVDDSKEKSEDDDKKKLYHVKVQTEITMTTKSRLAAWMSSLANNPNFKRGLWHVFWGLMIMSCSLYLLLLISRYWQYRRETRVLEEHEDNLDGYPDKYPEYPEKYNHLILLDEKMFFVNPQQNEEKKPLLDDGADVVVAVGIPQQQHHQTTTIIPIKMPL